MRNKKGITLIALIITIIVMLILAVITINMIIGEDGIIKRAQEASKEFNRQARKEKILLEDSIFITVNGNNHQVTGTTKQEMADIIVKNDLETNYLTILVENVEGKKIENIVYRYDLVTEEQRKKLEAEGIYRLKGDANKDGILDENDVSIIRNYIGYVIDRNNEHIIETCDMNNDGKIVSSDTTTLREIINGIKMEESIYKNEKKYLELYEEKYLDRATEGYKPSTEMVKTVIKMLEIYELSNINSLTILYEDKATSNKEKIVYRYNLLTEEEKTKIDNDLIKIPFLKGDADKDGVLTQNDVVTLQNAINNIRDNLDYTFIETTCDLDNNGNITLDDKQILEEYLAGTGTLYK